MIKIKLSIFTTVFLLATGCSTSPPPRATELEPDPQEPTHTIRVNIDSIPSGADVYAIEKDGNLGAKIGTTPFVHKIGVAVRWYVYPDTKERAHNSGRTRSWGHAVDWKSNKLFLRIALAKGDHSIALASKELQNAFADRENKTISLTVPLKTLAQVNQEYELYLRKQELANARNSYVQSPNQNQNITITQKKDELDSINSGLDALIKMSALGAFSR